MNTALDHDNGNELRDSDFISMISLSTGDHCDGSLHPIALFVFSSIVFILNHYMVSLVYSLSFLVISYSSSLILPYISNNPLTLS